MSARSRMRWIVVVIAMVGALALGASLTIHRLKKLNPISVLVDAKAVLEQWCGEQLLDIANSHLNPTLSFQSLVYEYPATVQLNNVRLVSEGTEFIHAASMRVEFTEMPKTGQPIVIQTIELTRPTVHLIQKSDGMLLGFSNMIKPTGESSGKRRTLSETFAIRKIAIVHGTVQYETPDRPPMLLDQLTFNLTSAPHAEATEAAQGWYSINASFDRSNLFSSSIIGRINIDSAMLEIGELNWQSQLEPDHDNALPPQLQMFVRDHEITGDMHAQLRGMVDLQETTSSSLDGTVRLDQGRFAFGDYVLPVETLDLAAGFHGQHFTISSMTAKTLDGTVQVSGDMACVSPYATAMKIAVESVRVQDSFRAVQDPPKYAGRVDLHGQCECQFEQWPESLQGQGSLAVREGDLLKVSIIASINKVVAAVTNSDEHNDRGSCTLQAFGDRIEFRNIEYTSHAVAGKGEGEAKFDNTIHFRFNAGPIEKLEGAIGKVGELLGKVTDHLVRYEVTGTWDQPTVAAKPLGLDLNMGQ
jgi:hypothetical protein